MIVSIVWSVTDLFLQDEWSEEDEEEEEKETEEDDEEKLDSDESWRFKK